MIHITHTHRFAATSSLIFAEVTNLHEMDAAIKRYGATSAQYEQDTGAMYEVYCEFFCKRFGLESRIGAKNVLATCEDKYNVGFDFSFTDATNGLPGMIQTKWRNDSSRKFTRLELGTFSSVLHESDIKRQQSILFTNLSNVNDGVFHFSFVDGAKRQFRVWDYTFQSEFIERTPSFFDEFRLSLEESCKSSRIDLPTLYDHQQLMLDNQMDIMMNGGKGKQTCATGGGKSLVQDMTIRWYHAQKPHTLTILVEPTIDMVNQRFNDQYITGMFDGNIKVLNFNTGTTPDHDDKISLTHTTNTQETIALLCTPNINLHVNTTYASIDNLIDIIKELGIVCDNIMFDEYHNLISQQVNQYGIPRMEEFLLNLPTNSVLYYSASTKHGRVLSALDERIFGKELTNITYKYLYNLGILLRPTIVPIRMDDTNSIPGLSMDIQTRSIQFDNVDIKAATIEAACTIVAYEDAIRRYGFTNLVTFSERVNHCKLIGESAVVKNRVPNANMHVVHAKVKSSVRGTVYNTIKSSKNNILLQHSCVTEGVDVTNFNAMLAVRSMGIIETQQAMGRVIRANRADTTKVSRGELVVGDSTGWIKPSAAMYIKIDGSDMEVYYEQVKELILKLRESGLDFDDFEFAELPNARHGVTEIEDDGSIEVVTGISITKVSLDAAVNRAKIQILQDEQKSIDDAAVHETIGVLSNMLSF